ncbi:MAG: macro domain-containing protein [Ardenticatenaceae bacterium]|nr:macro domain-containing protein [Ardenticatenaceae bacterium]
MVEVLIGDLFDSKAQTLVNTVNTVGVMGKGIALEFKKRFPDMYEDYVRRCKAGEVRLGEPYLYKQLIPPWIVNFPTKDHWRSVSKRSDIVRGLEYLEQHYQEWGITSLAVPPLGCGYGQLDWRIVGPTLYRHLSRLNIPVELYAPHGTPNEELSKTFLGSDPQSVDDWQQVTSSYKLDPAWFALVEVLARIEREPYHWRIGRTSFQKIAYFATECGLPTGLFFQKGSYGPFSPHLKAQISKLVNNGLIVEDRVGQMFVVRVGPAYKDAMKVFKTQIQQWEPTIDRLVDLFLRMQTQQAEVAATVHFAAYHLVRPRASKPSEKDVLHAVQEWKQRRKPPLDESEVATTIRGLNMLSWLNLEFSPDLPVGSHQFVDV